MRWHPEHLTDPESMMPSLMPRLPGLAALAVMIAALCGCESAPVPSPNRLGALVAPPIRPSDDLLTDPTLQSVVEAQNRGNASALLGILYNGSAREQARAALAMGSVRERFAFQALRDQLGSPDPRVRADVAFAMGQIPRGDAIELIEDALEVEPDSMVRTAFVRTLGLLGSATTAQALVTRRPDVTDEVLVLALGRIALGTDSLPPEAMDRLVSALGSSDGEVRELAAWYFGRESETERWADRQDAVRTALDAMSADDPAASGLLRGLGRLADPSDVDRLIRFGGSADWRLRVRSAAALRAVAAEETVREALFAALNDSSLHVSMTAAESLAGIRRLLDADMDRMEAWIQGHPDDWRTGGFLLDGLAAQGRAGFVRAWLEARASAAPEVRARGIQALAGVADQGMTRFLLGVVRSQEATVSSAALQALVDRWALDRDNPELHQAYWDAFSRALRQGDRGAVTIVAGVMADSLFVERGSVSLLGDTYQGLTPVVDVEAALAVVDALGSTGIRAAIPELIPALQDEHLAVRRRAVAFVQRLSRRPAMASREPGPVGRSPDWVELERLGKHPRLVLETEKGRVVIRMATELAPVTVQTIAEFAREGLYDGVPFHRVVPDFVIQGGDFERGDGYGGPGFAIRTEITGIPFLRGVVGMASAGPDTEGSQFFVTHSAQPHLDADYTAFGWVEEGMEVVDVIYQGNRVIGARVEPDDAPVTGGAPAAASEGPP
jgi:peptidylprolyl isomerase